MKKKICKHFWIKLREGWVGSGNTWSDTSVSTFNEAIKIICAECKEKRIIT